MEGFTYIS